MRVRVHLKQVREKERESQRWGHDTQTGNDRSNRKTFQAVKKSIKSQPFAKPNQTNNSSCQFSIWDEYLEWNWLTRKAKSLSLISCCLFHTHTLTHPGTLSLSLSLTHTHTHTYSLKICHVTQSTNLLGKRNPMQSRRVMTCDIFHFCCCCCCCCCWCPRFRGCCFLLFSWIILFEQGVKC